MKKIVIVVVVLVLLLVLAPFGVGKVAEKRLDYGLDKLVENAPYLKVVERKYTPGWFKSEQVVTFEAFGSWMEAFKSQALGADAAVESEEAASEAAAAAEALPDGDPPLADLPADAAPTAAAEAKNPLRFTVRNEVLHGPVLGLSGFGIARVNSYFIMSEKTRKEITEIFGPKDPLEISTRVGFLGGGTTTFKSEGRKLKPKGDKVEISWETFKLAIGYSHDADKYDIDGMWPKLEVKNLDDGTHFVMTEMRLDGDGKRVRGDLYDGDFDLSIDKINVEGKGQKVEVSNAHYIVDSKTEGDYTGMSARMGTGDVKAKELTDKGIEIKEIHYDLAVRHLHAETLVKMLDDFKAMYAKPLTNTVEANEIMFAPFKEHGMVLLNHDPEFVIERIGMATPDGAGYMKGVIKLVGVTAEDFTAGGMALIAKVDADISVDVDVKMLEKLGGAIAVSAATESGYVEKKGDKLTCKIIFKNGELTVNGKPQAIPGLGGPPPGAEPEAAPPQE